MINRIHNEQGGVYVLTVLLLVVIIAMAGLLIDGGVALYKYSQLSGAVDSAALAALDSYDRDKWAEDGEIELDHRTAYRQANAYLRSNMPEARIVDLTIDDTRVQVTARSTVPVFFMQVFGQGNITIETMARGNLDDSGREDEDEEGDEDDD